MVAADGANSRTRAQYADVFGPDLDQRHSKYMWLGTDRVFEAFQFFIKQTEWGTMQVHGYPYSGAGSTFIVEMHEDVWRRAGFDATESTDLPPGASDHSAIARLRELFAGELAGHELFANNSRWLNFTTVRNQRWHHGNLVLVGDAAHTAHFSIGSGTKLAMEDSLALAACLHEHPDVPTALAAYEAERRPVVESTQRAAQASLEWFENIGLYMRNEPEQFCFNLLTRSRRITYDNLRERDAEFAAHVNAAFSAAQGAGERPGRPADVPAVPAGRPRAEEPRHRLADGHVLGRRRGARGPPPGSPRLEGHGRGRPGDDRDGVRVSRGPHHAGLHRPVDRRAARLLGADHRVRS